MGFVETVEHSERKSGAGAWSLRAHHRVADLPFAEFQARFATGDVPFHRIAYFKRGAAMAW